MSQQTKTKFPQAKYVDRVIELKAGEEVYAVTGTLYKHMKLKPCVLDEYTNEAILQGLPPPKANYTNEEDSLILEDGSGRVTLVLSESCDITVDELVSGVVAGVCGNHGTGDFTYLVCVLLECPVAIPLIVLLRKLRTLTAIHL